MKNQENIKTFVRQTLGCGCPEEVFEHMDCRTDVSMDGKRYKRLSIGNRLLIYIFETVNSDDLDSIIPLLVDKGRNERDRLGFNRLRLVLAPYRIEQIKKAASEIFEKTQKDEKIHMHIIDRQNLPEFV
jgi:hypothetical protein